MAPEMVIMLNNRPKPMFGDAIFKDKDGEKQPENVLTKQRQQQGYTAAVDWWSLGVTIYKLMTGARPFTDSDLGAFVALSGTMDDLMKENAKFKEYSKLFKQIEFPDWISPDAKDFISKLLDVDDKVRLGTGKQGVRNIKKHPFFASIDWSKLEVKQVEPPFKPEKPETEDDVVPYSDLEALLTEHGKGSWMHAAPPDDYQKYFLNW